MSLIYRPPTSTYSSDDDLITIAPPSTIIPQPATAAASSPPLINDAASTHSSSSTSSSWSSSSSSPQLHNSTSIGSCAALGPDDCARLWECMLALQRRYGCYRRSARMQAASYLSEQGLGCDFMPSRAAMDLLNDSLDDMPEDGWRMLAGFVPVEGLLLPRSESESEDDEDEGMQRGRTRRRGVWPRLAKRLSWTRRDWMD